MKIIYLLRHGNYDHNTLGLNDQGKQQVRAAAESMKDDFAGRNDLVIYHGPKTRLVETAQILREVLGGRLELRPELNDQHFSIQNVVESAPDAAIIVGHQPDLQFYLSSIKLRKPLDYGETVRIER